MASRSRTVIAPATLRSSAVTGSRRGGREHDPAEARAQVVEVGGQGQDRHDLGRDGDLPLGLASTPFSLPPRPTMTLRIARSLMSTTRGHSDRARLDAQRVLVVEVVVEEGGGQVVGGADRVVVAGQVEVEVLHRDDLAVAAAGRAALDPEHGAQARLADRHRGLLADPVQALGQADRRGRLALAQRRRA